MGERPSVKFWIHSCALLNLDGAKRTQNQNQNQWRKSLHIFIHQKESPFVLQFRAFIKSGFSHVNTKATDSDHSIQFQILPVQFPLYGEKFGGMGNSKHKLKFISFPNWDSDAYIAIVARVLAHIHSTHRNATANISKTTLDSWRI